jgi:L-Ala-D/L-Glu epimerase
LPDAGARIRRATLYAADLPLAEPFEHTSSGLIDTLNELVLKLESDDGAVGWGEMRGNNHYVTGDTPESLAAVLQGLILPRVVGQAAESPRELAEFVAPLVVGNTTAKSLVDVAMHDLVARRLGVPVHALLGGARQDRVHCHATLPFCAPEEAARRTRYDGRGRISRWGLIQSRYGLACGRWSVIWNGWQRCGPCWMHILRRPCWRRM